MKFFYFSILIILMLGFFSCSPIKIATDDIDDVVVIYEEPKEAITIPPSGNKEKINVEKLEIKKNIEEKIDLDKSSTESKSNNISIAEENNNISFGPVIKIGLLIPLSGKNSNLGQSIFNSMEMALFETVSKNMELLFKDSGDTIEKAIISAQELEKEGVSIIIGPIFSSQALAVRKEVNKNIPIFSFTNDESISKEGMWALGFTPQQQIKAIFSEILNHSINEIAVIVPNTIYGDISLQASRKQSIKNNIKISYIYRYDASLNNFSDLGEEFSKNKNINYNGILIIASGKQLREISARAQYRGISPKEIKYFGISSWNNPEILGEPALLGGHFIAPQQSAYEAFVSRYYKIYDFIPPEISGLGYDIIALCSSILRSSKNMPEFISLLTNPSGFNGIFGFFRVGINGNIDRKFVTYKVMERNFVKQREIMP